MRNIENVRGAVNVGASVQGFAGIMPEVAKLLLGEPNKSLSSKDELRYGARGSLCIDLKDGTFFDHEAREGGGVLDLISRIKGCRGAARWDWLREHGFEVVTNGKANGHARHDEDKNRNLEFAGRIGSETQGIEGSPAEAYLKLRGIDIGRLPSTRDLRFHAGDGKRHSPALVALVRDPITGNRTGSIHRVFIGPDGGRALGNDGEPLPKKSLGSHGNGVVYVGDLRGGPVYLAEGLEDALSASFVTGKPAIATLGCGRITNINLSTDIQLVLLGQQKSDRDRAVWIKAAQHFANLNKEVALVWPGARGDINELLTMDGPAAVKKALESAESFKVFHQVGDYRETATGIEWCRRTRDEDVRVPLTNFLARIVSDITQDDGVETNRALEIQATINGRTHTFPVSSNLFAHMAWAIEHLGAEAVVQPGQGSKDRARAAIQVLSGRIPQRRVFTHTGWRAVDGQWVYMHGGGALGPVGTVGGIEVQLPEQLDRFVLPDIGDDVALRDAVEASLSMRNVAPARVMDPLLGAVARAVIGGADFSLHISGPTGAQKSELAALAQQHFGFGMDARALPASWSSTGNALEAIASAAKDALLSIDDYVPQGTTADRVRLNALADRVLRAQGNRSGRQRLRSDATMRRTRPPRGLIVSTGEEVPGGQSLRARMVIIEVQRGDVDLELLTHAQNAAAQGAYAMATAGFIRWLAPRLDEERACVAAITRDRRTDIGMAHARWHQRKGGMTARCHFQPHGSALGATKPSGPQANGGTMSTDPDDEIRAILANVQFLDHPCQRKLDTRPDGYRITPAGESRHKQPLEQIDRVLAEEHRARATARTQPQHAEPGARPGPKRRTVGRPSQSKAPSDGLNLADAFSIAGAKARKRRERAEKFGIAGRRPRRAAERRQKTD